MPKSPSPRVSLKEEVVHTLGICALNHHPQTSHQATCRFPREASHHHAPSICSMAFWVMINASKVAAHSQLPCLRLLSLYPQHLLHTPGCLSHAHAVFLSLPHQGVSCQLKPLALAPLFSCILPAPMAPSLFSDPILPSLSASRSSRTQEIRITKNLYPSDGHLTALAQPFCQQVRTASG